MSAEKGAPRVVRSRGVRLGAVATSWLTALLALSILISKQPIPSAAITCFMATLTWTMWRLGVHVKPDYVIVVGIWRSSKINWDDIERFEVRRWNQYRNVGWVVRNPPLSPVHILGIGEGNRSLGGASAPRQRAQDLVDELNRILAMRR